MAPVWATLMHGCVGGLLDGVRRVVDEGPCLCRARQGPAAAPAEPAPDAPEHDRPDDDDVTTSHGMGLELGDLDATPAAGAGQEALLHHLPLPIGGDGEMPPGPWRWRWVWPTAGRPSGMALVAADGTLVLWSPGGFAPPGAPGDGRPTADVATALANLPELAKTAAGADTLRDELERARAVADETRQLLNRAADTVDDEIGRVHRPGPPSRPDPGDG
jgi:hypothetical protein